MSQDKSKVLMINKREKILHLFNKICICFFHILLYFCEILDNLTYYAQIVILMNLSEKFILV